MESTAMGHDPRRSTGRRMAAALAFAVLLSGCSDDGGIGGLGGFGGGGKRELVSTDLGRGYVDGATTTIVAPPDWEGETGDTPDSGASGSGGGAPDNAGGGGRDGTGQDKGGGGDLFGFGGKGGGKKGGDGGSSGSGGRSTGDLSQVAESSVSGVCPASSCTVDSIDIDHPGWGPTRVYILIEDTNESLRKTYFAAVDSTGEVKWSYGGPATWEKWGDDYWGFVVDEPDADQAVYVQFNPGRYPGVIALHPTKDGFHSLPDAGSGATATNEEAVWFYPGELGELDNNGIYEIHKLEIETDYGYRHFLTWTGDGYEELRPKESM